MSKLWDNDITILEYIYIYGRNIWKSWVQIKQLWAQMGHANMWKYHDISH